MWLAPVIGIVLVAVLLGERWRGRRALAAWKNHMAAQGEIFDPAQLWPPASADSLEFSNRFAQARLELPAGFSPFCGMMSGWAEGPDGKARRGSQTLSPLADPAHTWLDLEAAAGQAAPTLQTIRALLQNPPAVLGDMRKRLEDGALPNYVNIRVIAQMLHSAALNDLHKGNLAGARENLIALSACGRLNEGDATLVGFMIRVAVTGLAINAYWDALQADGWTENQLAELQHACQAVNLGPKMSKALEGERASRLYALEQFRSGSYGKWITRHEAILASFGTRPKERYVVEPTHLWRQCGFHPLWRLAWADQEELLYLQHMQADIEALRKGDAQGNWQLLKQRLEVIHQQYQPPTSPWRFYFRLPIVDSLSEVIGPAPAPGNTCPFVDFTKAWATAHQNLTQHNLVITGIALKRHHLRHGRYPATLAALVPEFLATIPTDLMDGQALRYRLNPDGSPTLYSVGADFKDDGGTIKPPPKPNSGWFNPMAGPDWVWP
jgi:hypothetical protein